MVNVRYQPLRSGVRDWLLQRASAVLMLLYSVWWVMVLASSPVIDYPSWIALTGTAHFRIFSTLILWSFLLHAWIGIWTVITDYVAVVWRTPFSSVLFLVLCLEAMWGLNILWG